MAELTATISEELGTEIAYQDLPETAYAEVLTSVGLPRDLTNVLADADAALARGELFTDSDDLTRLIGRPATHRRDAVRIALAGGSA